MVKKLIAEINKVYFINKYTLVHILSGTGSIEVDFLNYTDWEDKAIYLSKGQYIKFLSDDFTVRLIEFPDEILFKSKDVRVLFKHLIALGYINFKECTECQKYLTSTVFNTENHSIIDISAKQWYWQNPFQANKEEYQLIFDAKDVIDQEFKNNLTSKDLADLINTNGYNIQHLIKDKIGISLKKMVDNRKVLESKKEIAFTDKSIKEVAYNLGYNDPAYFNRVFTNQVGQTPNKFRTDFDFESRNRFVSDLIELIKLHHKEEHQLEFYAQKMNVSVKTLSKKVKDKMHTSIGKLIRHEIITTSKTLLLEDISIQDVSLITGFEEVSHFSNFFTHQTGISPSQFKIQKVQ
ncbi:helix-turn-helix domain-containing protein [Sabulilitoribacter multivorans]|uniref:Helix-turn-helix domain-containing protein n=1 Tax=Flaviramulus multivorans TaxID=1304750 RepID=A0ABS9IJE3_9FLAO|nr:helix-turn-helix domain-containing protein [Flaviramulus multivorans]MCF7560703.1 helix-turn-helix domain-containing protein [Flaviramulus multivorans]